MLLFFSCRVGTAYDTISWDVAQRPMADKLERERVVKTVGGRPKFSVEEEMHRLGVSAQELSEQRRVNRQNNIPFQGPGFDIINNVPAKSRTRRSPKESLWEQSMRAQSATNK